MRTLAGRGVGTLLFLMASGASADLPRRQLDLEPFSILDAQTVGDHRLAFAFGAGFPYVQVMAAYNLGQALDLDLNVDSVYGAANQLSLGPKLRLAGTGSVSFAGEIQAQWALFRSPAAVDSGIRHLTGMRNFGIYPQLILSMRGRHGSLFASGGYQGTLDTEPTTAGPLAGYPGSVSYGSNVLFHVGGEISGGFLNGYGLAGVDFHLANGDQLILPVIELGFSFPA